jgi:phosphate transport system substrate-binding protein
MLLDGQLTISQSSRPIETKEFEEAKTKGFELEQVAVAIDGIAFYVDPQLSIPGLTVAQIKDIFTGKITN